METLCACRRSLLREQFSKNNHEVALKLIRLLMYFYILQYSFCQLQHKELHKK